MTSVRAAARARHRYRASAPPGDLPAHWALCRGGVSSRHRPARQDPVCTWRRPTSAAQGRCSSSPDSPVERAVCGCGCGQQGPFRCDSHGSIRRADRPPRGSWPGPSRPGDGKSGTAARPGRLSRRAGHDPAHATARLDEGRACHSQSAPRIRISFSGVSDRSLRFTVTSRTVPSAPSSARTDCRKSATGAVT